MIKRFKKDDESKKLFLNSCSDYHIDRVGRCSHYEKYDKRFDSGLIDTRSLPDDLVCKISKLDIWEDEPKKFGVFSDAQENIKIGYMLPDMGYPEKSLYPYKRYGKTGFQCKHQNFIEIKTLEDLQRFFKEEIKKETY